MSVYIVCCWAVYRQCLVYVTFKCYHYLSALLFGCCCCCCYSLIFINISKAALVKCFISFRFASFHFALFMFLFDLLLLLLFFFIQMCNGFFLLLIIGVCSKIYLRFSPSFLSSFFLLNFFLYFFDFCIFSFGFFLYFNLRFLFFFLLLL